LSCRSFAANAVRLQLHALAYNLGNFLRTLATPEPIKDWSLTTLKEKLDASKNSPFGCVSDSIRLAGSETNRCADIQDFLMSMSV
jgi:Transposase DDE domain group 1